MQGKLIKCHHVTLQKFMCHAFLKGHMMALYHDELLSTFAIQFVYV